ncbi:5-bromo-4-chloroindolyl phosphate hydrolysis family protein [uncultured Litoreibacter sp.]|uniref:5-bromo-4-chloroindolyl phosphate hydrolysis family protein n=1 Tax=uncultured Litoreibacter sp. TaxID=1392394 RepID=UPI00260F303B|nr:5-bromo-4-chloroindolyl phosphate hydrolysis family protein [uncultured Litoreibacter sp.]
MAQRYGGEFSPDSTPKKQGTLRHATPQRGRSRAVILGLAGIPLLVTAFGAGPTGLAANLIAFASIALAAWLTREGLEAEEAYNARTISRRPAIPRKLFGAVLTGLGVGIATFDGGLVNGVLYGVIAAALHITAFGFDPMKNKVAEGVDDFQNERVAKAIDEAEAHLTNMAELAAETKDRVLIARVDAFRTTAREMFRTVENDPRDLPAARRYLGVYLQGARDATKQYVDLTRRSENADAKASYMALLDDLEANFTAKTQKLLTNNKDALNIEIDVLRDRLQREGITLR